MANPNILNSTSVKYFELDVRLQKELFTISTSATSDYQTKNIVFKNEVNSGKVFKINKIYYSNQQVRSGGSTGQRDLYLTFITDYTVLTNDTLGTDGSGNVVSSYSHERRMITNNLSLGTIAYNPTLVCKRIFPAEDTETTSIYYGRDKLYFMEGNAFEAWAEADSGYGSQDLDYAEYFRGRARLHIEYEEYTG